MPNCSINGCSSKFFKGTSVSFFSLPLDQSDRNRWMSAIESHQAFDDTRTYYVCSRHFQLNDMIVRGKRKTVVKGKSPSIFSNLDMTIDHAYHDTTQDVNQNNGGEIECDSSSDWNWTDFAPDDGYEDTSCQDNVLISKEKYKHLVDQSVELIKQKILNKKLKEVIEKKAAQLNALKRTISQHEYLLKRKEAIEDEDRKRSEYVHEKKASECSEPKQLEILECLRFGNSYKKYSPTVRLFCFTLHFYSPKAYEYLRSVFNLNLPSPRTLRSWLSNIDSSPGFTESAFDALKEKVEKFKQNRNNNNERKEIVAGLIFDEMYIRRHSQWDKTKKEYQGHITAGAPTEYENFSPLANQVLLLMVCGINEDFKIPIGYFLVCGIQAEEKVAIISEALRKLSEIGIKLGSITADGINVRVFKLLGANFNAFRPYFNNPYDIGWIVYVLFDPVHMLKLIRNCLGRVKELIDSHGNKIMWQLIVELVSLQTLNRINLCNKLTKTHVEYKSVKMNVRVACETISNSTASAIEFLDSEMGNDKFSKSIGTTQYLRTFNNVIDIMNSKKNHTDDKFKRPICAENINEITEYFDHIREYIQGINIVQKGKAVPVLKTKSFTPFFGFMHNMNAFLGIYKDYVVPSFSGIHELYTFAVSQDHVESFFGCVRQMGGNNCNPTAEQFAAAYRRLLFRNEVTSSNVSNCQNDITKILEVSSRAKRLPMSEDPIQLEEGDIEHINVPSEKNNEIDSHSNAYLASELERKVMRKIQLKGGNACDRCLSIFNENEKINDKFINFLAQRKKILQPCESTMYIIDVVENVMETYHSQDTTYASMITYILNNKIDSSLLYESSEFGSNLDHNLNHKHNFVKLILETYLDMKCIGESKFVTRIFQNKLLRHHYLKEVHRAGQ